MTTSDDTNSFDKDVPERLSHWIYGEETESLPSQKKAKLQAWLSASPENQRTFDEFKATWKLMGRLTSPIPAIDQWSKVMKRIEEEKSRESSQLTHKLIRFMHPHPIITHSVFTYASRVAAVILLAIGIYIALSNFGFWYVEKQEVATVNAERTEFELSEGTVVHLNSASKLRFPKLFSGVAREVFLEGEAYFEVKHQETPFIVQTSLATIRDIGTEFNVRTWNEKVQVAVKSGRVAVRSTESTQSTEIELYAGEMSEVGKDTIPTLPKKVDVSRFLGWRKGILTFEHTPLSEVVKELERQYNIRTELSDPAMGRRTLTGTFDEKEFNNVLSAICLALDIHHKRTKTGVLIFQ